MKKPRRPPRPRPTTRAALLAREQADWDEMTAAWRGLPERALTRPGACGPTWSVKDVMNHVAAWQEAALRILPELLAGRRATLGAGTDRYNKEQQAAGAGRSLAATRRRLSRSRRALLALIGQIPDAALLDPAGRVNWWVRYTTYSHYGEHIWELSEWRKQAAAGDDGQ
ncbi:MAG: maleylpyruvate isomerase N-terminal domain-containing protein [Anaerolineales bacterium]|nr:maleylpyruvate isomerase N-terminal domain-containing protein [Anaerolineales bacterium]